jgi:hypothetical protein
MRRSGYGTSIAIFGSESEMDRFESNTSIGGVS